MKRIRELDILRTVAIFLMIIFHILYDLNQFCGVDIEYYKPPISTIGDISGLLFIFISGISCCFSKSNIKRGALVFLYGMVITIATYLLFRDNFIIFGILHFLGTCIVLAPLMKKINTCYLVIIGIASGIAGYYFMFMTTITWVLVPFGITYEGFSSADYYPIFPYISVFIAGIIYYRFFYKEGKSIFNLKPKNDIIEKLSRKSLLVYLLHQPFILIIMFIVAFIIKL